MRHSPHAKMKRLVSVSHSVCPLAPPFANEQAATTDIEKATALRAYWDVQTIQQRHSKLHKGNREANTKAHKQAKKCGFCAADEAER